MTKEEIINAAIELVDYGTGQHNADSPIECFKKGAEFMDNHWQEKTRWIPVEERLPDIRENEYPIYAKNEKEKNDYAILVIDDQLSLEYLKKVFTHWKEIEL